MRDPLDVDVPAGEIERAARILAIRSRREVASALAGGYTSAFRGGGLEFEESRPYVPGDDVRTIDWNATARTGEPHVKRFREEREKTLLLALDVSASMRFGTTGRAKAAAAARALALLAAAAGRAGDRVGLLAFDAAVRSELPAARGEAHVWRVVRTAVAAARGSGGGTDVAAALTRLPALARQRCVLAILSDFRDDALLDPAAPRGAAVGPLASLARRHDVLAIALSDPRDDEIPPVGAVRLADPERSGRTLVLRTSRRRARARYRAACAARRRSLEDRLARSGLDLLWLRTDHDPLRVLLRFFQQRAARAPVAP